MPQDSSSRFRSIEQYASRDIQSAAILSQADAAHAQVAEVTETANEPLIPRGSKIIFRPTEVARVTKGRFLFLRREGALIVRRLIRRQVTPQGLLMVVATASGQMEEPLPSNHLLGEILTVETADGKRFDPAKAGSAFKNWLTEWNTCSPGKKLGRTLLVFLPPRMRGEG